MIREIIVVEGKDDTAAVKRAVRCETIETGGSAVSDDVIAVIRSAQSRRGVIVLTDPDYPGERIRRLIREAVPGCKHAFIPRELAMGKNGKIGVEYASPNVIRDVLAHVCTETLKDERGVGIAWDDFVTAGLTAHPEARRRREAVGRMLGIGYANARGLYERLQAFGIAPAQFWQAVRALDREDGHG